MRTLLGIGETLASYGFPGGHPFGPDRHDEFLKETRRRDLLQLVEVVKERCATESELQLFHTSEYISLVQNSSKAGSGLLDHGDTPAFPGVYEAAATIAGTALDIASRILLNKNEKPEDWVNGFMPIAGLHHARRSTASGFCVFNDCAIVAQYLFAQGLEKVAYVDIDAHHGDGVFYGFEDDSRLIFADIHQNGIYPGTGDSTETGTGNAKGKKLNLPVSAGSDDEVFYENWQHIEEFLFENQPEFILLQCGADSIEGDPITTLSFSAEAHRHAAKRLKKLAEEFSAGRLMGFGGGGYNRKNLALAWNHVLEELIDPL